MKKSDLQKDRLWKHPSPSLQNLSICKYSEQLESNWYFPKPLAEGIGA